MAGIGDLLFNMWQPDPEQAIGQWSDAQQAQNRRAIGLDANGNPIPQPAEPAAAPDGGDQAAVQAQSASTLPPGQEPNATKTPVSLGHLLMNLQQRNEADQGLNQALGQGFAAFAQPRDREMVSKMFNVDQPNVNQTGMTQMNLAGQQQGQDRMNALGLMLQGPQGDAIAGRLNITKAQLIARYQADPQGVGAMIQNAATPTDQVKNYVQGRAAYIAAGHTPAEADIAFPPEFLTLAPGASLEDKQYVVMAAQLRNAGQPVPTLAQWQNDAALKAKLKQDMATDQQNATQAQPAVENKLNEAESLLGQIQNDPNLPALMKKWTPSTGVMSIPLMTDGERALAQKINNLSSDRYVAGFNTPGLGSRKTQFELDQIAKSMTSTLNANNLNVTDYQAGLQRLKDSMYAAHADTYGETGSFAGLDSKYNGYINDAYRTGPLASTLSSPAPARVPPTDAQKQWFNTQLAAGQPRDELLTHLKYENIDTSKL